jgi:hypothetical protein
MIDEGSAAAGRGAGSAAGGAPSRPGEFAGHIATFALGVYGSFKDPPAAVATPTPLPDRIARSYELK